MKIIIAKFKEWFKRRYLPDLIRWIMSIKKDDLSSLVTTRFRIYKTDNLLCIGKKHCFWKYAIYNKNVRFKKTTYIRKNIVTVGEWKIDELIKKIPPQPMKTRV